MASDRIHLSGEEEKAEPSAGDPSCRGKGLAEVPWNPGKEASLCPAVLAGNGEHLAALSSCLCVGWAAESRRLLRWHRGLTEGSDLGIALCRLRPTGCPLHRTPVGFQAGKLRRGERARGGGWAGRQKGQRGFSCAFGGA